MTIQRLPWRVARVADAWHETPTARSIVFDVPQWPGHDAGQHLDLRLTAEDGYRAQRAYSIAMPADGSQVVLTVQRIADGEVSPYLVDDLAVGDEVELRGPVGGWFTWRPQFTMPVLLVAGGSGIVPLMAMVRERRRSAGTAPFTLVYSARTPEDVYYADELRTPQPDDGLQISLLYTRTSDDPARPAGRIAAADVQTRGWPDDADARAYLCGPTGFVEAVTELLLAKGHDPAMIRTERFGPAGG
jgi:ferredoxin-NADP reductase